jgi:hypothetical protein
LGTLLTIFVTPRLQHYFWKRQKREEIRLTVVTEVNRLAAEFNSDYMFRDRGEQTSERMLSFYPSWISVAGQVKGLFSPPTYQAFDRVQEHIMTAHLFSAQELKSRIPRITEFDNLRNTTMKALYIEIGILKREAIWRRFYRWVRRVIYN